MFDDDAKITNVKVGATRYRSSNPFERASGRSEFEAGRMAGPTAKGRSGRTTTQLCAAGRMA